MLLVLEFIGKQRFLLMTEMGFDLGSRFKPPGESAQIGLAERKTSRGQMHAGEHFAHAGALELVDAFDGLALEPIGNGKGLAADEFKQISGAASCRTGDAAAVLFQVLGKFQIKGQLLRKQALENGEHPASARGVKKIVRVLDAR